MRSPLWLLSCALVFAAACDPGSRHRDRIRSLESKATRCPADQLQIERLERLSSNSCYAATYRVSGCGHERQYTCAQRNSSDPCSFRCDPVAVAPDPPGPSPDPGPSPGPGRIVSHQCGGRPCPQPEPVDPVGVDPTWHHRAETCWIDQSGASQPADVDMMLYVVGLNHNFDKPNSLGKAVDREGVKRLADVIATWPHPERVVIVSSSFTQDCLPTSGKCLEEELEARTRQPFALSEVIGFPGYPPTIGVISGSRWEVAGKPQQRFAASNPGVAMAEVLLRDRVTQVVVPVYALHTKDGDAGLDEIKAAASFGKQASGGRATPIIAGDFNMTVTTYGEENKSERNAAYFRKNFHWVNDTVPCSSVAGLPGGAFQTQDGNKMHALVGSTTAEDPAVAFTCAPHYLERVSMSYSVDRKGRLANPPRDRGTGPSWREGIALYDIAHNVLAFGLRLKRSDIAPCTRPLSAGTRCDNQTGCSACPCAAGLSCQRGAGGRSFCRACNLDSQACTERCTAQAASCRALCQERPTPTCDRRCNQESAACHARCEQGVCN